MPNLNIGDMNLYYQIIGQGPPVLFIHGLGSSTRDWEPQIAYFATRYQLILFDVRGHGQSDKPPGPYSVPLFATDTAALIKSLDIAPVHVVGMSMGGMIAFQLAVQAPELVKTLVIVNSVPAYKIRSVRGWLAAFRRLFVLHCLGMRKMGQFLGNQLFIKPEQENLKRIFIERWAQNDLWAYSTAMRAIPEWSVLDQLPTIRCPTLVVSADEDVFSMRFKKAYVTKIPQAEMVIIPDSRHFTTIERPLEFNKILADFLAIHAP